MINSTLCLIDCDMFSESIQHVLAELIVRFKNLSAEQSSAVAVFASCVVLLLTWRIWTFTIIPRLHPYEPKELPYWVPCKSIVESSEECKVFF